MVEHILIWAAAGFLLLLCLPFSGTRKLILELCTWTLRVSLIALLAAGAVLWFRPELLPVECVAVLDSFPAVRDMLPSTESQTFGLTAAVILTAVFLPLLTMLDVTRKLAGSRLRRIRAIADATPHAVEHTSTAAVPVQRRPDRREAADAMAQAGSRKPYRVSDNLS